MFQSPVTSLFRLLGPNTFKHGLQRSLVHLASVSNLHSPNRPCLPLLQNNLIPHCKQPLQLTHLNLQQRFVSQSTNADKQVGKSTDAANVASADSVEGEDDILYKRLQIEARCADRAVLESYEKFVSMSANYLGINISRVWEPFRTIKRRTLLRASFVKKKYRVQYEWRTYYRCMEFKHLTGSTADTFLEYIERNLPESVALKVTREQIEKIPSHLVPPAQS